jgi:hypothetical protein
MLDATSRGEFPCFCFLDRWAGDRLLLAGRQGLPKLVAFILNASSLSGAEIVVRASPTRQPRAIVHLESRREVG